MTKTEVLKLVRAKCLDCCCDSPKEVSLCQVPGCALFSIRSGKDPRPRVLSEKQRAIAVDNLRRAKEKKNLPPGAEKND